MILIVDDDEAGRYAIARKLTARGHLTAESVGGEDALRVLDTMAPPPRLVLLDWFMPYYGGADTLQAIRSVPRFKNLPVIVFSAVCSKETTDAAMAAISSPADKRGQKSADSGVFQRPARVTLRTLPGVASANP